MEEGDKKWRYEMSSTETAPLPQEPFGQYGSKNDGSSNLECSDTRSERVAACVGNDNDNDTLREVPHPSNEGLALQARVSGS